ncbi:hypothetical protein E1N52_37665 [Paraburkholderia guartelaensis]|uniref:Porin n=1 Tax=Paraburkholderia guartelaensis TaxID=2546446 RepID=A0A4R5L2W9_9BURK|nr:hypothetical protein [Paraburkholderia guartelaensis]TDG02869.1 hypothetical protein E1N52_37665 [Paraburkholderia guartelaensis]
MFSPGCLAGNFARNRIWPATAGDANSALTIAAGYPVVQNPNSAFFGSTGSPAAVVNRVPSNNTVAPVYSGYASANSMGVFSAAATWTTGSGTAGVVNSNTRFRNFGELSSGPSPRGLSGAAMFNNVEVNFRYQFTPILLWGVAYNYTHGNAMLGKSGATYNQFATGLDYLLSKR